MEGAFSPDSSEEEAVQRLISFQQPASRNALKTIAPPSINMLDTPWSSCNKLSNMSIPSAVFQLQWWDEMLRAESAQT